MASTTEFLVAKSGKLLATPAAREAGLSALKCGWGLLKTFAMAHPVLSGTAVIVTAVCLLNDD